MGKLNVLVIGVGDGLAPYVFKKYISDVKTLDKNKDLKPNFSTPVKNMPFENNDFGIILHAEALEYLPFEKLKQSLTELKRVAKNYVILEKPQALPIKL